MSFKNPLQKDYVVFSFDQQLTPLHFIPKTLIVNFNSIFAGTHPSPAVGLCIPTCLHS